MAEKLPIVDDKDLYETPSVVEGIDSFAQDEQAMQIVEGLAYLETDINGLYAKVNQIVRFLLEKYPDTECEDC